MRRMLIPSLAFIALAAAACNTTGSHIGTASNGSTYMVATSTTHTGPMATSRNDCWRVDASGTIVDRIEEVDPAICEQLGLK